VSNALQIFALMSTNLSTFIIISKGVKYYVDKSSAKTLKNTNNQQHTENVNYSDRRRRKRET